MKHKISKATAALAVAIAAVFAAPAVASAYTPDPVVVDSPSALAPGEAGTVTFDDFAPGETVEFTLTGFNASGATLALVAFSAQDSQTITKDANAEGEAAVTVTLPSNARGTYTLAAVGQDSGTSASTTIAVAAAGPGDDGSDPGTALPNAGFDGDALLGLWVGGGVLVLAGASIAVATSVRRARRA
ncbi:hypothetical protein [Microbacterium sp. 1P06AB]|uniref:hypothetical protein n=1 Tax=Microbacterium sp. 1P06AB TaxID=3132289 RepID=UPI0039A5DEC2